MKKAFIAFIGISLLLIALNGCSNIENTLSEAEAKKIATKEINTTDGVPTITKVQIKSNKYIVYWENIGTYEKGTATINKKGEVVEQTHQIP